jgi:hypothetical protein
MYVCTHTHTHKRKKMTHTHTHTHTRTQTQTHMYQRKVPKREKKTMLHANRGNDASTEVIIPLITGDPISLNVASTRSSRVPGWCAYADTDSEESVPSYTYYIQSKAVCICTTYYLNVNGVHMLTQIHVLKVSALVYLLYTM